VIELFHVFKAFPGDPPVLSDVTLHVDKGEFIYLTGPSGAGKTTLLKLLFCAEKASAGQILVGGRNVGKMRASAVPYLRRNIGVVFQDFKLLPHRTVFENVAFALDVLGTPRAVARDKVRKMLKLVGLDHKALAFPPKLSGGEQQRVVIARALVNDPTILLADEPTGNLDPHLAIEILELLNEVNVRGTTILLATHDTHLLQHTPRRTVRLERGRVVADEDGISGAARAIA
jgi:cell division transport system ATP-binding protein